jgi:hypothetical protein
VDPHDPAPMATATALAVRHETPCGSPGAHVQGSGVGRAQSIPSLAGDLTLTAYPSIDALIREKFRT